MAVRSGARHLMIICAGLADPEAAPGLLPFPRAPPRLRSWGRSPAQSPALKQPYPLPRRAARNSTLPSVSRSRTDRRDRLARCWYASVVDGPPVVTARKIPNVAEVSHV